MSLVSAKFIAYRIMLAVPILFHVALQTNLFLKNIVSYAKSKNIFKNVTVLWTIPKELVTIAPTQLGDGWSAFCVLGCGATNSLALLTELALLSDTSRDLSTCFPYEWKYIFISELQYIIIANIIYYLAIFFTSSALLLQSVNNHQTVVL